MAVACARSGLSMSNFSPRSCRQARVPISKASRLHLDEGPRLIRSIGDKPAVILRNHGLLAWGDSLPRTFAILWLLNRACEIQLASTSMGAVIEIPEDIQMKCTRDSQQFNSKFGAGQDVFDALTRMIDRVDPSYRQ
jgi:ribulose-5-phosphate 4-epimerase/fuculose-1-phosphate aldolase